jgi:hypothetical protein
MVAFATPLLAKLRVPVATLVTWTGLGAITVAAFVFTAQTSYPGAYVALPVIGAAMVIAGGCAAPGRGAEWLLGTSPFRHLGRVSYSLYLWHWPILIIAAESQGQSSLSWTTNMAWLLVALLASIATYLCLENPIRRSRWLRPRSVVSILMGLGLVAVTLLVSTTESSGVAPATTTLRTASIASSATFATVESRVRTAPSIRAAPTDVQPPLGTSGNVGFPPTSACTPINYGQTTMRPCLFGDPQGEKSMVLYGDSHSAMWFQTIDDIATTAHWKLWYLGKSACPVELLPMMNPGSFGSFGGRFTQCDQWHSYAIAQINRLRPNLVIVTQEVHAAPGGVPYSSAQWREGLEHFFASITIPGVQFDVIGNIPQLPNDPVRCLAAHSQDVQVCSASRRTSTPPYQLAEAQAVQSVGGRYIDVTPWFCSTICTAVIGQDQVYFNQQHVMGTYATFLGGVMARALQLPISVDSRWRIPVAVSYPRPRASLRGAVVLVAAAGAPTGTKVEFILTGPGTHETVIAVAQPTLDGWISFWNSNEVPNGRYELRIVAHSENNGFGSSKAVPVTVVNSG